MQQNSSIQEEQILQHAEREQSSNLLGSSITSSFDEPSFKLQLQQPVLDTGEAKQTKRQRRGRPESRKGIAQNIVLQAKHYTTLWQAQLFYCFKVRSTTNSFSTQADQLLPIQQLAPLGQQNSRLLQFLRDGQLTDPFCSRLVQFLQKMRYARSPQITVQFFQIYFQVIRQYIDPNRTIDRDGFIEQMAAKLMKTQHIFIRSRKQPNEDKEFQKLLKIICHCIVATIQNDPKTKQLGDFKY